MTNLPPPPPPFISGPAWWKRSIVRWAVGVVLGLGLIGAAFGDKEPDRIVTESASTDQEVATTTTERMSAPSSTTTEAPTTTAAPTTTVPPTTTTTAPPPSTTLPPPPPPAPRTSPPATQAPSRDCHPSYDPCVPYASDVDCAGGSGDGPAYTGPVRVIGPDEYDLDRDGDGYGCESS